MRLGGKGLSEYFVGSDYLTRDHALLLSRYLEALPLRNKFVVRGRNAFVGSNSAIGWPFSRHSSQSVSLNGFQLVVPGPATRLVLVGGS